MGHGLTQGIAFGRPRVGVLSAAPLILVNPPRPRTVRGVFQARRWENRSNDYESKRIKFCADDPVRRFAE